MAISILVKAAIPSKSGSLSLAGTRRKLDFQAVPLMPSIDAYAGGGNSRALNATSMQWHALELKGGDINPWDACHAAVQTKLGFSGRAQVKFAEPDLDHEWVWKDRTPDAFGLKGECGEPHPQQFRPYEGVRGNDLWFLDKDHSGLAAARDAVGASSPLVRIAHLDTGYDPEHVSRPAHLRVELARNFVEGGDDAVDRPGGVIIPSHGHGVATLALLAGDKAEFHGKKISIGGAAHFEVVPLRVAKSVVLFKTSGVAKAFNYVHELWDDPDTRCHIITMSMGGLASAAWADAVNALYNRGVFVVTAAGNNFDDLPTRFLVYPARFRRVMAACGVMAQGSPYADLPGWFMQGNYGPKKRMNTAMSAFTPNVPWAKFGCRELFDRNGGGTSSATPQLAAAAALWMQKHRRALDDLTGEDAWRRVELTRAALMRSAKNPDEFERKLGAGSLQADKALRLRPNQLDDVLKQKEDSAAFALIRGMLGLGIAGGVASEMLELEALQVSQRSQDIEAVLDGAGVDPEDDVDPASPIGRRILEALADNARTSRTLKMKILETTGRRSASIIPAKKESDVEEVSKPAPSIATEEYQPPLPSPPRRNLRVYSFDPSIATNLDYFHLRETTLPIKWEENLSPGPVGEYLEVVDIDPPANAAYAPVDLNNPTLLAQNGHEPSEGNPQFHQQMVYAVCMRTISVFEHALGRPALWSEYFDFTDGGVESRFVRRLRVYPHALREANAYYSPVKKALLFGYFNANEDNAGDVLPGGLVFTCLSHDIVVHEISHALLDGLHPRFGEPTNVDVLAFHEAFSDIVALFQHFMMDDALEYEIAKTRGDLTIADLLGGIAVQFGQAVGHRGALRSAIAEKNEDGEWRRIEPSKDDYHAHQEPHARGAVLVSAVFDAFLRIYQREADEIIKLATNGTGVLPDGDLAPGLAAMLAREAAKIAMRVLNVCIRALDYCPPVDPTFGELLRATITADRELVPNDDRGYRVAFVSAFRDRGIYPSGVTNLSETTLVWHPPSRPLTELEEVLKKLIDANLSELTSNWNQRNDRLRAYQLSNEWARQLYRKLVGRGMPDYVFDTLGIVKAGREKQTVIDGQTGYVSPVEIHSVRTAQRIGPGGLLNRELIIELTQKWSFERNGPNYRGGCTIIYDPDREEIKYVIRKRLGHKWRTEAEEHFKAALRLSSPHANYFTDHARYREPFAFTHRL